VLVAVVALALAGCASAPPAGQSTLPFPAPDSGPGRPNLDRAAAADLEAGWQALRRGDAIAAERRAARTAESPASRLLALQSTLVAGGAVPVSELAELVEAAPAYAAAWLTLSVAAERAGEEKTALDAASRGAALWPDRRWEERVAELRTRWIDDRLGNARRLSAEGSQAAAVGALEPVLALEPNNRDARILQAGALTDLGDLDRAEAALVGLPRDAEVVLVAGAIAEARGDRKAAIRIYSSLPEALEPTLRAIALAEADGDWLTAMNLYGGLPDRYPDREAGLRAAKLRWRVSVLPPYVGEALAAERLDRAGLAVVLVALAPRVESLPGGQVPLLSDIVDMPSQREIITAARLGLIDIDRLEHRFDPHRQVTEAEVREALVALGRLLEVEPPRWCGSAGGDCVRLESPITGRQVAEIVIAMAAEEIG
jgi:tetratricopeptide (TPR) repeat protein